MKKIPKTIYSEEYRKLIGEIVALRYKKRLTIRQLADILNVPHSYIGRVEKCERRLDVIELIALLKALSLSRKEVLSIIGKVV